MLANRIRRAHDRWFDAFTSFFSHAGSIVGLFRLISIYVKNDKLKVWILSSQAGLIFSDGISLVHVLKSNLLFPRVCYLKADIRRWGTIYHFALLQVSADHYR